jgi:hypothetical protein
MMALLLDGSLYQLICTQREGIYCIKDGNNFLGKILSAVLNAVRRTPRPSAKYLERTPGQVMAPGSITESKLQGKRNNSVIWLILHSFNRTY